MYGADQTAPNYSPVATDENSERRPEHSRDCPSYPGASLRPSLAGEPPADTVLVKTGGNALQAVDQSAVESEHVFSGKSNLIAMPFCWRSPKVVAHDSLLFSDTVIIPEGVKPGQTIFAVVPDGSGRFVSAVVPEGCFPGHNLLVTATSAPLVVTGVPVDESQIPVVQGEEPSDLLLTEEGQGTSEQQTASSDEAALQSEEIEMMNHQTAEPPAATERSTTSQQHDRLLIQVPPGVSPGSKIRVKVNDGRTIDVVVPPGETSQFFVQVPRNSNRQNWHDSPVAYAAPMVIAPLLL